MSASHRLAVSVCALVLMVGTAPASYAADLGGNCCSDLEERIAELEAATARKGNRKVTLEIYGQVHESVMFWDDGVENNQYIVTNDQGRSRFGFRGKAKVNADIEVGYRLEIGVRISNSKQVNQSEPDQGAGGALDLRDSNWFVKSKSMGTVTVGTGTTATNAITEIDQSQTNGIAKYSDVEDTGLGMRLRASSGALAALTWRQLIGDGGDQPGEGERALNTVRYETPTMMGFTASTSWSPDDLWDVALRYSGEANGFKLSAGIGYGEVSDAKQTQSVCMSVIPGATAADNKTDCRNLGGSVSVLHEKTGIFVNFAAGMKTDELLLESTRFTGTGADDEQHFWSVDVGIEQKLNSFGKTTVFGQYYDYSGGANARRTLAATDAVNALGASATIWESGVETYTAGIIQNIDAASMQIYAYYRHYEADLTLRALAGGVATGAFADAELEDLDIVMTGAVIKF